jgi:predicted nucleic acid-binding protein
MRVLIDTSAWIEFFRAGGDSSIKSKVAEYVSLGSAAYTCPVSYELFLGARPIELSDLREGLGYAERIPMNPMHWDLAAQYGSELRAAGLTVPAMDLLIATVATESKLSLLSCDKHFPQIRDGVLGSLKLV